MLTTFSLAGHWLEMRSRFSTGRAVEALLKLAPATARVLRPSTSIPGERQEIEVPVEQVVVGDEVVIRPGDRVPVDEAKAGDIISLAGLTVATVSNTIADTSVSEPIKALAESAKRLGRGDYDTPIERRSADEVGALARAFFIFVGPAAVIGHRLAAEIAFAALKVGVVDQHNEDLAAHVLALEIVPAALGRFHAIADEHQLRPVDVQCLVAVGWSARGNLLALGQRRRFAGNIHADGWRRGPFGAEERHRLGP